MLYQNHLSYLIQIALTAIFRNEIDGNRNEKFCIKSSGQTPLVVDNLKE